MIEDAISKTTMKRLSELKRCFAETKGFSSSGQSSLFITKLSTQLWRFKILRQDTHH